MNKPSGNQPPVNQPLLAVEDLQVSFKTDEGLVRAVRGVSFDLCEGETLGIVGESGSGKSVTNMAMMGLVPQPPGQIDGGTAIFDGLDLLTANDAELRKIRGKRIAMIFQDPMTALNPLMTIEQQLIEAPRLHMGMSKKEARHQAIEMLELVGIASPAKRMREYPHQFSGGMRQRVMIAMALSCEPDLLIADEPTTALDVTIQAQILDLLSDLQERKGTSIILITHDLGVVAGHCDRVMVMYAGRIVEKASTNDLFASPQHPYTVGLLESLPRFEKQQAKRLPAIAGQPPDMTNIPFGCAYRPRCPFAMGDCANEDPALVTKGEGRETACIIDVQTTERHPSLIEQELAEEIAT